MFYCWVDFLILMLDFLLGVGWRELVTDFFKKFPWLLWNKLDNYPSILVIKRIQFSNRISNQLLNTQNLNKNLHEKKKPAKKVVKTVMIIKFTSEKINNKFSIT
jgi:hypothetical protein